MKLRYGVVILGCLALASCGGKTPKGQVAATVDGKEITFIDLKNEMNGYAAPDAKTRKLAETAALDQIVQRKLLVDVAKKQKLDQSPEFVQQKEKADDNLLLRFWQAKIAKAVPPPSKDEIARFIPVHPELYAQHRTFLIDQIRMPQAAAPSIANDLKSLKTLPDVAALLTARKIPFQEGSTQIDALQVDPRMVVEILKVPADDVFVVPSGNLLLINKVREVRIDAVPNEVAEKHAEQYLLAQRTQDAVQRDLGNALAQAKAKKGAVKYAKGYGPPAPPPKGNPVVVAPATPAGAPAAAAPTNPQPAASAPGAPPEQK